MKRITTLMLTLAAVGFSAFAGGLLHNTNQHIAFMRMMARGASHEIDAVYTNPAGLAFMDHDGWTLSLNIQSASQRRDVLTTFGLFPEENHTRLYKGKAEAPVIPSLYGAYKKDRWTFSGFFGFTGGGGKCSFDNGLPVFDMGIIGGFYTQTGELAKTLPEPIMNDPLVANMLPLKADKYDINSSMKGRQYIYGLQLGATYKITDWMSAYVGGRMNYFDGNYNGYVKVLPKAELAKTVQQIAMAYPPLANTLKNLTNENGEMANIELDCNQTGWGITPIIGVDLVWKGFTLAAKYEFKTKLNIENDTKKAIAWPAAFEAALEDYKHGVNTPNDLPAVLYTALGYEFIPNKLRATVEYHYYDDKHAHMAKDKQKALRHGTHEVLAGVEWDINKMFTVSAGAQNTDYGLSDDYQTHTSFSCDSYSIGFGGAINVNEKIKVNLGYFWTNYKDYKRVSGEGATEVKETFSRTNKVFGAGIDFKF